MWLGAFWQIRPLPFEWRMVQERPGNATTVGWSCRARLLPKNVNGTAPTRLEQP